MGWIESGKMSMKIEDKLYLDRYKVDEESHLRIIDPEKCLKNCRDQPCLYFCPANVYRLEGDRISVNHRDVLNAAPAGLAVAS